jgi:hypothetical protein
MPALVVLKMLKTLLENKFRPIRQLCFAFCSVNAAKGNLVTQYLKSFTSILKETKSLACREREREKAFLQMENLIGASNNILN